MSPESPHSRPPEERVHEGLVLHALYPLRGKVPGLARVPLPLRRVARRSLTTAAVRAHLARCRGTRMVAVTGSRGKTTLKDLAAAMLSAAGPTVRTRQNDNGLYGVPASLLSVRPSDRFAVIELGLLDGPGEIGWLSRLVRPDVGVLTGIGTDHLPAFGSREAIAREKGTLLDRVGPLGTVVVNADDDLARATARDLRSRVLLAGWAPDADVRLTDVRLDWPRGMQVELEAQGQSISVEVALHGRHLAPLVALSMATAIACEVPPDLAAAGAGRFAPAPGRMHPAPGPRGTTILSDDHKSRLGTAIAAVRALGEIPAPRRIAVLGELQELAQTRSSYEPLARELKGRADVVLAVGDSAAPLGELLATGGDLAVHAAEGVSDAARVLGEELREGDVILLHGANAQHLQRVQLLLEGAEVGCRVRKCTLAWRCTDCPWLRAGPPDRVVVRR